MAGYSELSTSPIRSLAITGVKPSVSWSTVFTVHDTFGTFWGTRPYTYFENISSNSGRLSFHHISAVVTFWPLFSTSGSGIVGNGSAFGLIVVCVIRRLLVSAVAWSKSLDPKLVPHVLSILVGRERNR